MRQVDEKGDITPLDPNNEAHVRGDRPSGAAVTMAKITVWPARRKIKKWQ